MTALATFLATAKRIDELLGSHGQIAVARDIPRERLNAVNRVQITAGDA